MLKLQIWPLSGRVEQIKPSYFLCHVGTETSNWVYSSVFPARLPRLIEENDPSPDKALYRLGHGKTTWAPGHPARFFKTKKKGKYVSWAFLGLSRWGPRMPVEHWPVECDSLIWIYCHQCSYATYLIPTWTDSWVDSINSCPIILSVNWWVKPWDIGREVPWHGNLKDSSHRCSATEISWEPWRDQIKYIQNSLKPSQR